LPIILSHIHRFLHCHHIFLRYPGCRGYGHILCRGFYQTSVFGASTVAEWNTPAGFAQEYRTNGVEIWSWKRVINTADSTETCAGQTRQTYAGRMNREL